MPEDTIYRYAPTEPRAAWEQEPSFHESLDEWMTRAPWVLLSGAAHFVAFIILAAIPWSSFEEPVVCPMVTSIEPPPEEVIPPEEKLVEPIDPEPVETEPIIDEFPDDPNVESTDDSEAPLGDPDSSSDAPFELSHSNKTLGLGPGGGSKFGTRFGSGDGRRPGGAKANLAVAAGLKWLAEHQDESGAWDADDFAKHDPQGDRCSGPGSSAHDTGVTGLALLAFLGDGHTMTRGHYRDTVVRGIRRLIADQDRETGALAMEVGQGYMYDHAIATLALAEALYATPSTTLKARAQSAVNYITRARNPYRVWRYSHRPDGLNDTSVTGWMIFALKAAEEAGLKVDREAYAAAIEWFDEVTDPTTGRAGYTEPGSLSSRVPGLNDDFPTDKAEALTAVTLLCRYFLGQTPEDTPIMEKHAELLAQSLPEWNPEAKVSDMYYWYYGSYALYQVGGSRWNKWNKALKAAVIDSQRKDGSHMGSWDPIGPWGHSGGRVYSTATMVLTMEVYYRYSRLLGSR